MVELLKQSNKLLLAIMSGILPAIFWLFFWIKEEDESKTTPIGLVILTFILGGLLVFIAIFLEKFSLEFIKNKTIQIITWSSIEEILKFLGVMLIIQNSVYIRRPIDYPMYFISTALGFAALENILYLLNLFTSSGAVVGMFTGNLRFLGATLLHAIASGMIGSSLGLAFYSQNRTKYLTIGIICAIMLHSVFNFFIMKGSGENFLSVFGFLWVVTIINILIFEKLKRMDKYLSIPQFK